MVPEARPPFARAGWNLHSELSNIMGAHTPTTTTRSERTVDRCSLVTAGYHFLLNVLPFREPDSSRALATFIAALRHMHHSRAELDAVLLRCLVALDEHERRIPSLVDRYLADKSFPTGFLEHFTRCVQDFLRYRCISDGSVQHAVDIIESRYREPLLNPRTLAESVGARLSTLDVSFKRQMACTITEYLRGVRLERAALLLATTNKTVKEVWAEVGYNHASNFNHEFKLRFGRNPRQFRADAIRPLAQRHYEFDRRLSFDDGPSCAPRKRVLIVDDDECTRGTLRALLERSGYSVSVAKSGREGLRHTERVNPDVILLDFRLGDIDGLEFLELLRSKEFREHTPVALFTADWSVFDRCEYIQTLRGVVVSKLCDFNHVKQVITNLTEATGSTHEIIRGHTTDARRLTFR
jgi:CheY-like chemotaxis protein/AraC-like DNA-binding protein